MISINAARGPVGKLTDEPWITAPETLAVIDALTAKGTEVRFVGGCVRDAMARKSFKDIDLGTPDPPETVIELLKSAGIKAIPTGIEHGTITAIIGNEKFEITTLRRDIDTDGRRATVAYTYDWVEDSNRRDFTINALSATPGGDVYDPHDGLGDLAHGRIRFVGLAKDRIEEDVLRLLRFFRFYGLFGRPPPDKDAMAACRSHADKLPTLSGERVQGEVAKIMLTPNPADVCVLMHGIGIFEHILPEAGDVGRLRSLSWLETRAIVTEAVFPDALRRLAALLDTDADGAKAVGEHLHLSNKDKERLSMLCAPKLDVSPDMDDATRRRALHEIGTDRMRDLALLAWAGELSLTPRLPIERTEGWKKLLEECNAWKGVTFPVQGRDAANLGVAEGPRIGELMAALEDWWEEGDYKADREACLKQLKLLIEGGEVG
ncbi:MAG: CCA tRNA nucleotidyltransferase [Rhodospirillales bacterium]